MDLEILYLYGFTSRNTNRMENFISIIKEQIRQGIKPSVVLIQDGVIGLSKRGLMPKVLDDLLDLPINTFGMKPDLLARGINLSEIDERIKCIDYDSLVDLMVGIPKIASWM